MSLLCSFCIAAWTGTFLLLFTCWVDLRVGSSEVNRLFPPCLPWLLVCLVTPLPLCVGSWQKSCFDGSIVQVGLGWAGVFLTGARAGAVQAVHLAGALPASSWAPLIQRGGSVAPAAQAGLQHSNTCFLETNQRTGYSIIPNGNFSPGNSF